MKYIDTHAHYNDKVYKENLEEVLNKNIASGVEYIVNVGYDIESSKESIELSKKYKYIYATIGIHPHEVFKNNAQDIYELYNKNKDEKIVAIGEIGLDYAYVKDNKKEQAKLFIEQIELANTLKLPIIIHSRDASLDTYNIIKNNKPKYGALFHCFQPSDDLVRLVKSENYSVAFGGNITYKRNESFKRYIEEIPIENIVIETDSPYLSPEPYRGKVNSSANLNLICEKLAIYKGIEEAKLGEKVYLNSKKFFNIK